MKLRILVLALPGTGFLFSGLSPWDQLPLTHSIGAHFIFIFGFLSCIIGSRMTTGSVSGISIVCGILSLFSFFSGYLGGAYILGSGGIERMIFYPILLWAVVFGGYLVAQSQSKTNRYSDTACGGTSR